MGKISPVSAKYIINATIEIEGVVDRPDVIGAIFGQTEGLLGSELELRELQRSGRIGRIEVSVDTINSKTKGSIIIPSSLDKAETSIVGASLEVIQRIGPCNAKISVSDIEDVRVAKRSFVIERAKELLKTMMDSVLPDSQELAEEVAHSVRMTEIKSYGKEKLPCGPSIEDSDEIIIVEGRADVLTLLKYGFKNVIAINGTSIPHSIVELTKKKIVTVFVDGDRGGNLIMKELFNVADIDFVTRAPDGKEVEELTKKEIHKAIRAKVSAEQGKLDVDKMLVIEGKRRFSNNNYNNNNNNNYSNNNNNNNNNSSNNNNYSNNNTSTIVNNNGNNNSNGNNNNHSNPNKVNNVQEQKNNQSTSNLSLNFNNHDNRNDKYNQRRNVQSHSINDNSNKMLLKPEEKQIFRDMLETLIGTRGGYILDKELNILGKVPVSELLVTLKSLNTDIYAIVFDGLIDSDLIVLCEKIPVTYIVGMKSKVEKRQTKVNIITVDEL